MPKTDKHRTKNFGFSLRLRILLYFFIFSTLICTLSLFSGFYLSTASPSSLTGIIIIFTCSFVLIIVSAAFFISKSITQPLKNMVSLAKEIGGGSLSKRINYPRSDEIGALSDEFNKMAQKLEEYYLEMDEKIKTQQKYLLNILNDSVDGIVSLDENDRIMTWNKGAEIIYGYKASEIVGKSLDILVPDNLKEKGELENMRQLVRERGFIRHYETERITRDSKKIIVDITKTLIKGDGGKIVGYSAIIKDVTERRELEKRLIQTEKLTVMGQIAANIAHEIKNPLMGISGSVQVLMKKYKSYPTLVDTLEKIFEQVQRLDSTLKGLLSFARPQTPYFSKSKLNEIIDQILFFISPQAKQNRIEIQKELSEEIPEISLDPDQIKQVFLNIILNSIQAMPRGGTLKITTENSNGNKERNVKIKINDTGLGIAEEFKDEVFKPFFTTKVKGTGLGLVISRNIVKEHGGGISFSSTHNKGSTFEITLPVEQ